ncbi:MAG: tRNA (N6-isopentenyl adenosine(37)-C2)-methylthiotransferase MiaB [Peptococcaceae bacterium]|nr:tRNA (N6-isopentenyl adenosine(37)-C2)-methylthiotransferase MiaB [Peptococcaceae bacterium]
MTQQYYHTITFGCQMNERDTETVAGMCEEMGYTYTATPDAADLIVINTCCVRESAENRILGRVGNLKHLKTQNSSLIIALCGCMVQQDQAAARLLKRAPHLDILFGTHNIHQLPSLVAHVRETGKSVIDVWQSAGAIVENLPTRREGNLKAFVNIMYGCNNFCTYCIVPHVRGRERSRAIDDIVAEIADLAQAGFMEVNLLGQNVNSYGKDLAGQPDFADLLLAVNAVPGIARIRFTTSHPRDLSDKMILAVAEADKVCEHFHLPVQAGSNAILHKMNRGYTREYYLERAAKIRALVPGASISTDLIVGFPGETETDFAATLDLVAQVRFSAAFTFIYSPRTGTAAAKMPEQIPLEVKKERLSRLMAVQNDISLQEHQNMCGQILEVLVEGESKTNKDKLVGRARTNELVIFNGPIDLTGQLVPVKIIEAGTWTLTGEFIRGEA